MSFITVKGKYAEAKVFSGDIDEMSLHNIRQFLNSKTVDGSRVRFMPDFHAGVGCVIGTTATVTDKIIPNVVGVDVGCGVLAYEVDKDIDLAKLDKIIHTTIPSGTEKAGSEFHKRIKDWPLNITIREFTDNVYEVCRRIQDKKYFDYASRSLGTLGGGK